MLPKHHIIIGLIASLILLFFISPFYSLLFFLASVFIDIDHYIWYTLKKKDFSLKNAYYFLKDKKIKLPLMLFHTLEFHVLILILGFFWQGALFLFYGMLLHSFTDIFDLYKRKKLGNRIFSLILR